MKTLTDNEHKVADILLESGGGMKRNHLERNVEISKSSLAGALSNLEMRNVLKVDKSKPVHYVELTPWFKSL